MMGDHDPWRECSYCGGRIPCMCGERMRIKFARPRNQAAVIAAIQALIAELERMRVRRDTERKGGRG